MGREIERKYLVRDDSWKPLVQKTIVMQQAYLMDTAAIQSGLSKSSVRIRIENQEAFLNIKSVELGVARDEYEYAIPFADGKRMLDTLCGPAIYKHRHLLPFANHLFEIDEFDGANRGLVVAECELQDSQEAIQEPSWLGKEVTHLSRYYNVHLMDYPWSAWTDQEQSGQ